jgi:hypothetical protein
MTLNINGTGREYVSIIKSVSYRHARISGARESEHKSEERPGLSEAKIGGRDRPLS